MRRLVLLGLTLVLVGGLCFGRSSHDLPDQAVEQHAWFGDMLQGYVVEGCLPAPSSSLTLTLPACRAYGRQMAPARRLQYIWEETARSLTLPASAQTVWLVVHVSVVDLVSGWTRLPGTHWLWQAGTEEPVKPDGAAWVAKLTTSTSAVTAVEALMALSPLPLEALDATVYATQHGMRCDGVSDNSAALEAAQAALPVTGGRLVLPMSDQACLYSRTLRVTKTLHLVGMTGKSNVMGAVHGTILTYTGTANGIELVGNPAFGSILEDFTLTTSTGVIGILIDDNANNITLSRLHLTGAAPSWSQASVLLGSQPATPVHSVRIDQSRIADASPIGVHIGRVLSYARVTNSTITDHTVANIQVGGLGTGTARNIHLSHTDFGTRAVGQVGVKIDAVEGLWISGAHCEVYTVGIQIANTATQAEGIYITTSFFNLFEGATAVVLVALATANVNFLNNDVFSAGTSAPVIDNRGARTVRVVGNRYPGGASVLITSQQRAMVYDNYVAGVDAFQLPLLSTVLCATGVTVMSGTGETNLLSCLIPGGTLGTLSRSGLELTAYGKTATNSNAKRVRVYVGGQLIADTTALAANNADWLVRCAGLRSETSGGAFFACDGQFNNALVRAQVNPGFNADWSLDQVLQVTGEGTTASDVIQHGLLVTFWR